LELVIQAALDGACLACVAEDRIAQHLATGDLVRVPEDLVPARSRILRLRSESERAACGTCCYRHGPFNELGTIPRCAPGNCRRAAGGAELSRHHLGCIAGSQRTHVAMERTHVA